MRAILFDMDGVLYNSEDPIAGATETLAWARQRGIPYLFLTNTTSRPRRALVEKLERFGIPASEDDILTPCSAAATWLKAHLDGPVALFVRPAARVEFDGLKILPEEAEQGAAAVVVGDLGDHWDYRTLNRAFRLLHSNPRSILVALGMTRFWQAADGLRLDAGPFIAALEFATGRSAVVLGKPARDFYEAAVDKLKLPAGEIVMVGDDVETDIAGAQGAGLKTVLVKTGKFRPADLNAPVQADAVLDSVAELPRWWETVGRE
ncbi:MAG: TIGR01458 family HAD-type hydrolase [Bryobacteraceae bacterium]|nr:TIGR01458 family HAD-type hydrolase [Bryobacteraceae bacterium]